ncbi:SDR family oxidoreductase [Brevibacterium sp. 50QC2O2]|jgi:NAD(P)-dependent dehydrogenase (short-subunit alcohol dehydrogenase family)|uniref:SDR family oxidoreductase n=1 Tax=Brevibacterium TaxID=1696 RepID=UPI00211CC260|nr:MULTISPECIES: SDR family oxidoreductase [unclassified Brevibacterium]MCQ9368035.1 SDR family oxidoreductase [Brevibacterium sp. 91QC2O2]MCQ9385237.1 SDR family oxidoreductase [Brevibacterium sp. 68QC2CO]MCQ9388743.1 SDR family oxidoreductase [Brevibacterium sp. 50QC2O2]
MSQRFAGKVAIVTGASRGIGLAIARRLVDEGARVAITARGQEALDAAAAELGGPSKVVAVAGKGDDPEHQDEVIARVTEAFGPVDLLVNNTGINPAYGPMIELEDRAARKIFEVNDLASLRWIQKLYRASFAERGGSVVNIASVAGLKPPAGIGFYGSSKAMLIQITEQLAVELGPKVRVNAVAPAVVKTRFAEKLVESGEDTVAAQYPLKRLGEPEDIANAVTFLLSDEASWITGQCLALDGGVTLTGGV